MHEKSSKNIMVDNAVISNRVVVFYFMYIVHEGRAMISNQGHHRGAPVFRHSSLRNKSVGSQEESTHRPTAVQYGFLILAWKVFKLLEGPALFFEEVGIFHNKNKEPNQLIIQYIHTSCCWVKVHDFFLSALLRTALCLKVTRTGFFFEVAESESYRTEFTNNLRRTLLLS